MLEPTLLSTRKLNEILELYQMQQLINNPTRVTELTQSLLDVCITSNPEHIIYSGVLHLGISDHSPIYAIRKINAKPITESQGYVEFTNFKKFKVSNFLNDLHGVPWEEIRNKSDVDGMWEICKTLFVDVLNKHAPIQSKRIRKRGNIPWLNSEVKAKLFKRESLKKKAIQTNNEHDWKLYRLYRNDANSALRSAKKDYYVNKFSNNHRNPKASWKTINDILGRSKKQDVIKEIKLPEKTVTIILSIICRLQRQPVLIKYQPRCSALLLLQLHLVLLRFLICQLILIVFPLTGRRQESFLCLRMTTKVQPNIRLFH